MPKDNKGHGSNSKGASRSAPKASPRYEVEARAGKHYVRDNQLKAYQSGHATPAAAKQWIKKRMKEDKSPKPSSLKVRMPVKD